MASVVGIGPTVEVSQASTAPQPYDLSITVTSSDLPSGSTSGDTLLFAFRSFARNGFSIYSFPTGTAQAGMTGTPGDIGTYFQLYSVVGAFDAMSFPATFGFGSFTGFAAPQGIAVNVVTLRGVGALGSFDDNGGGSTPLSSPDMSVSSPSFGVSVAAVASPFFTVPTLSTANSYTLDGSEYSDALEYSPGFFYRLNVSVASRAVAAPETVVQPAWSVGTAGPSSPNIIHGLMFSAGNRKGHHLGLVRGRRG